MAEETIVEQKQENKELCNLEEMMEAGLHFGHKTSKTHPKMKPYVAGVRNNIHIINLEKTKEKLQEALGVARDLIAAGKIMLLVGTKMQAKGLVRELAQETGLPYVTERWIGGLLTNFEMIQKRIEHLKDLESKKASEDFKKYTKWEQHKMEEEINKLNKKFGGVKNLQGMPDALFVFDLDENKIAIEEAKRKGIQVLAIVDTNCNPATVDYAIPANNDAPSAIRYIAQKMKETILRAKSKTSANVQNTNGND